MRRERTQNLPYPELTRTECRNLPRSRALTGGGSEILTLDELESSGGLCVMRTRSYPLGPH
ncbi:hypothetical protein SERLA73DRAFT_182541 [Serpula lacrymans var. lacrymans S7.3]|uniref:Uncharacterized protein n=2 Tax=Serpula lacrymans var. lacrymans TaxID=341189 RepID=F8Q0G4_SERL3|nr:uncharacterized protein SERLADRAFT_469247 [Serpula lacrymans var. lacrymans S7.9]EGN97793.1 hypothetical protein SERLA73DRAFT_182541 [Serpula lacrymans var. lacrymans S7.3]EGO23385.1 hypothetical protein SERLADRAFT_469247 [Serpula lacrymans var. lacrymans S7.9]